MLHVEIAHCGLDLEEAGQLIKPAILYADKVTVYSPVASLLRAVTSMADITDPTEQVQFIVRLVEEVPELAPDFGEIPADFVDGVRGLTSGPRPLVRRALISAGATASQMDGMFEQLDGLAAIWEEQLPAVSERVLETAKAGELWRAIDLGAVEVTDITAEQERRAVTDSVRAAVNGGIGPDSITDEMIAGLVQRVVEMITNPEAFPVLATETAGIVRAMEREGRVVPSDHAMRHGSEVGAASKFMAFLPSFEDLSIDEIVDLRADLAEPLTRFRAAMTELAAGFESRAIDPTFAADVEDAWRQHVRPALAEIEEALRARGLLRHAGQEFLGDIRRAVAEAATPFAASHLDVVSLSGMLTAAAAVGLPMLDVAGRALTDTIKERAAARRDSFYFLHQVGEASARVA